LISVRVVLPALLIAAICVVGNAQDRPKEKPAGETPSASPDRIVMKVGEVQVSEKQFESMIGDIEPKGGDPDKGDSVKDRQRLGSDYATVLMLSQIAVSNHLDSTPEMRQKLAVARMQILSDAEFTTLLNQVKPSSTEIADYYQKHSSDFDRVQIRRLFIWKIGEGSKNTRGLPPADAKARAAAILQASASGGDAVKLAQMFGESDQGILDAQPLAFVRGQLPAKMDKVAFTMKPGTWEEAEDTADHIILVYLAGRDRQPLPEVASLVERMVQGDKMEAKLDELKRKTGVWMDKQYFSSGSAAVRDPGEQRPASGPPSQSEDLANKK
jgi:hypothetical protein